MIALTITMIVGVIVVVAVLVIRMPQAMRAGPSLPGDITLPAGTRAAAVTFGRGWYGVVTSDDRFLVFDSATGELRQEVAILPAID